MVVSRTQVHVYVYVHMHVQVSASRVAASEEDALLAAGGDAPGATQAVAEAAKAKVCACDWVDSWHTQEVTACGAHQHVRGDVGGY